MNGSSVRNQCGLTLLELLVVIAILGFATATVTLRLEDTLGPAALQQWVSQFEFSDAQLRARARHTGKPTSLHLEIHTNQLQCIFNSESESAPALRTLGHGVRITKLLSTTQETTHGPAAIEYDERGSSPTFAIELTGHRDGRRWLVVAGLTGQITEVKDEAFVRNLLQQMSSLHAG